MKRVISAFLLIIIALSSTHTTWAWHYCGGILQSVTLADENKACCCGGKSGDTNKTESNNNGHNSPDMPQIGKSCCANYLIDIETDNFDLSGYVSGAVQQTLHLFFIHNNPLKISDPDSVSVLQNIFPPGKFARYNTDLLALNCILLI
jgi:hypothetical protein